MTIVAQAAIAPPQRLGLARAFRAWLVDQANRALPHEACGLLCGRRRGEALVVTRLVATRNGAADHRGGNAGASDSAPARGSDDGPAGQPPSSRDRFEIDPRARLILQRTLRETTGGQEQIIGSWHSHPSGRVMPSVIDATRAWEAGLVWLILAPGADGTAPWPTAGTARRWQPAAEAADGGGATDGLVPGPGRPGAAVPGALFPPSVPDCGGMTRGASSPPLPEPPPPPPRHPAGLGAYLATGRPDADPVTAFVPLPLWP